MEEQTDNNNNNETDPNNNSKSDENDLNNQENSNENNENNDKNDKINDNGFFGPNEFLIRAQRKEYTIKEFPVKWSENYRRIGPWQILVTLLIPLTKLWINLTFRKNQ
jgi:hypothetical protein